MALSVFKTYSSGEVLSASDLNSSLSTIHNNALSLISPLTGTLDANGNEIVLDADADTSITADTDDQIDFKLGGTDRASLTNSTAGIVQMLDRDVTIATVTGTVTETTVYTYSLPANTLGTNKCVRVTMHCDATASLNNGFVIRFKYGSTTIVTSPLEIGDNQTDAPETFVFFLYADGATNSQKGWGYRVGSTTVVGGSQNLTSAEDSTTALNIVITAQADTATGTTLDVHGVFTELLP